MKVRIQETIDYTLKRKGDRWYEVFDENGDYVNRGGCWKTKKACIERIKELGFEYLGIFTTHQNYEHWADFKFAEPTRR